MEHGRRTYLITVEVDEKSAHGPPIFDTVERGLAKLHRLANGVEGVFASLRILDDEGEPQGDQYAAETNNPLGQPQ